MSCRNNALKFLIPTLSLFLFSEMPILAEDGVPSLTRSAPAEGTATPPVAAPAATSPDPAPKPFTIIAESELKEFIDNFGIEIIREEKTIVNSKGKTEKIRVETGIKLSGQMFADCEVTICKKDKKETGFQMCYGKQISPDPLPTLLKNNTILENQLGLLFIATPGQLANCKNNYKNRKPGQRTWQTIKLQDVLQLSPPEEGEFTVGIFQPKDALFEQDIGFESAQPFGANRDKYNEAQAKEEAAALAVEVKAKNDEIDSVKEKLREIMSGKLEDRDDLKKKKGAIADAQRLGIFKQKGKDKDDRFEEKKLKEKLKEAEQAEDLKDFKTEIAAARSGSGLREVQRNILYWASKRNLDIATAKKAEELQETIAARVVEGKNKNNPQAWEFAQGILQNAKATNGLDAETYGKLDDYINFGLEGQKIVAASLAGAANNPFYTLDPWSPFGMSSPYQDALQNMQANAAAICSNQRSSFGFGSASGDISLGGASATNDLFSSGGGVSCAQAQQAVQQATLASRQAQEVDRQKYFAWNQQAMQQPQFAGGFNPNMNGFGQGPFGGAPQQQPFYRPQFDTRALAAFSPQQSAATANPAQMALVGGQFGGRPWMVQ